MKNIGNVKLILFQITRRISEINKNSIQKLNFKQRFIEE